MWYLPLGNCLFFFLKTKTNSSFKKYILWPLLGDWWKKLSFMDWIFVSFPNSYAEGLIPNVKVFGDGAFGRSRSGWSHEHGALHDGTQFSCSVVSHSLWPHGLQHARPPPSPTPAVYPNSCPFSQSCHPTISSFASRSAPTFNLSEHESLFKWVSFLHQVAKVLEFQLQHQSFQWLFRTDFLWDSLAGSPWSPRDSQECSPTPEFKSINSLALSFLYSPTLTSIHDYWNKL